MLFWDNVYASLYHQYTVAKTDSFLLEVGSLNVLLCTVEVRSENKVPFEDIISFLYQYMYLKLRLCVCVVLAL